MMAGVYIHIPFCKQLCNYCDFYFTLSLARKEQMLEALIVEMKQRKDYLKGEKVTTLYFGGGTPTVYSPRDIQMLIDTVKELWQVESFDEITLEANPDDLTDFYLEALAETDINRLSIGIQSFQDEHLMFFNRRHNAQQGYDAVVRAKSYGYKNITIDLIYGVPEMSEAQLRDNLSKFLQLEVPHLSAYHLSIEPKTIFGKMAGKDKLCPVDDAVSTKHYQILEEFTAAAKYEHYEVSNFALPGFAAKHNSNYWIGDPYIGIGPSAHSYDGDTRRWNVASNITYLNKLATGDYFETEILTNSDKYNEYIMISLRCAKGVDYKFVERQFGIEKLQYLRGKASAMVAEGLLIESKDGIRIPTEHFLLSDFIIEKLFLDK